MHGFHLLPHLCKNSASYVVNCPFLLGIFFNIKSEGYDIGISPILKQQISLEPTLSGCYFLLVCRKIPGRNDERTCCFPFTTHSLWNPPQRGGHLVPHFTKNMLLDVTNGLPVTKPKSSSQSSSYSNPQAAVESVYTLLLERLLPLISWTTCSSP